MTSPLSQLAQQGALGIVLAVYLIASPYLSAWLVLLLCRRNYDCPLRRENAASDWTAKMKEERGL